MDPNLIHIGSVVHAELQKQHRTVNWLAEQLGILRPNCYRLLHASSLHTDTLLLISIVLRRDFFREYSHVLEKNINN